MRAMSEETEGWLSHLRSYCDSPQTWATVQREFQASADKSFFGWLMLNRGVRKAYRQGLTAWANENGVICPSCQSAHDWVPCYDPDVVQCWSGATVGFPCGTLITGEFAGKQITNRKKGGSGNE